MVWAVLLLPLAAAALGVPQYWRRNQGRRQGRLFATALAQVVLLGAAALVLALSPGAAALPLGLAAGVSVAAAALGGGPATDAVLHLADRESLAEARAVPSRPGESGHPAVDEDDGGISAAAEVLRGGAWIGLLERTAIAATLWAGWPEGLAVVLAVKGLGRYPELGKDRAAERFILGTFASVLWACACYGLGAAVAR